MRNDSPFMPDSFGMQFEVLFHSCSSQSTASDSTLITLTSSSHN